MGSSQLDFHGTQLRLASGPGTTSYFLSRMLDLEMWESQHLLGLACDCWWLKPMDKCPPYPFLFTIYSWRCISYSFWNEGPEHLYEQHRMHPYIALIPHLLRSLCHSCPRGLHPPVEWLAVLSGKPRLWYFYSSKSCYGYTFCSDYPMSCTSACLMCKFFSRGPGEF